MNDRLKALADAGVSIWLDDLSRQPADTVQRPLQQGRDDHRHVSFLPGRLRREHERERRLILQRKHERERPDAGLRGGGRLGSVELFASAGLQATDHLKPGFPPYYATVGSTYTF